MALGFFEAVDPVEKAKNPDYVKARRKLLNELRKGELSTAPVQHWSQGLARMVNSLASRYEENQLAKGEAAGNADFNKWLAASLGGGGAASDPAAVPGAAPASATPSATPGGAADTKSIFARMLTQESGNKQFRPDGSTITSPAGALGIAQIMPGTAPEAAKLAGLPYDPARLRNDAGYNKALGQAYYNAQVKKFGDPVAAAAAYNAGPGAVNKAISKQDATGRPFTDFLPTETTKYMAAVGGNALAGSPSPGLPAPTAPAPAQAQPGNNAALLAGMSNPAVMARLKGNQVAMALLIKQLNGQKVSYQTTPDGTIIALDPTGRTPPRPVYQAAPKPVQLSEGASLVDPSTGKVIANGGGKSPTVQKLKMPDGSEQAVQWDKETNSWRPLNAPGGGKGFAPKLTEGQSKDQGFYVRGLDANRILTKSEGALTSHEDTALGSIPLAGNSLVSPEYRRASRAARDVLSVILRKDTGAAVTPQEFSEYGKIFIPAPGDDAVTIKDKATARALALDAIKRGLGNVSSIVNYATKGKFSVDSNGVLIGGAVGEAPAAGTSTAKKPPANQSRDAMIKRIQELERKAKAQGQ